MPPRTTKIFESVINAIIGMIATLFVLFGTGAWSSLETREQHDSDIRVVRDTVLQRLDRLQRVVCSMPNKSKLCEESKP